MAREATSITDAASHSSAWLYNKPVFSGWVTNLDPWGLLDSGTQADCISLATLACAGLGMLGIGGQPLKAWPTADGSPIGPPVSEITCHNPTFGYALFQGQLFDTRLVYPGTPPNNFEAFFTVLDPNINAFTVAPPRGPLDNQEYYYLQVLKQGAGEHGDQYWIWAATETKNGITVTYKDPVPGAPHIPVPDIPAN